KEKVLAARRAKIKKVIIPQLNRKDLDEIPQSVRTALEIIPVEEVKQVLDIALTKQLPVPKAALRLTTSKK
ncbi:MAG TPA: S16 family serine protease, partial [Terriglobia bacterium]|nr:S16 family serine protease [Terriglobia bacterium]